MRKLPIPIWTWFIPLPCAYLGTLASSRLWGNSPHSWPLSLSIGLVLIQWWGPRVLPSFLINAVFVSMMGGETDVFHLLFHSSEAIVILCSWLLFTNWQHRSVALSNPYQLLHFLLFGIGIPLLLGSAYQWLIILIAPQTGLALSPGHPISIFLGNFLVCTAFSVALLLSFSNFMQRKGLTISDSQIHPKENFAEQTDELQKLSRVVDQNPNAIVVTDKEGSIEYVNSAFCQISEYTYSELVGKNPSIVNSGKMPPQLFQELWATITRGDVWRGEILNKKKCGDTWWSMMSVSPIRDQQGIITHYLAIQDDVTERKRQNDEFILAKEGAESSVRAKSAFISNMSHEIRTPMNSILGFIELAIDQHGLTHQTEDYLHTARESAQKLLSLINDILEMSNLDSDKATLKNEAIHLSRFMRQIMNDFQPLAQKKGLELQLTLSPTVPKCIVSDPNRLQRILVKLIGNGIKFTDKGHVCVELEVNQSRQIQFSIKDTGIGMTSAQLERIFMPFTQADDSDKRKHGGMGLGTTISRQLVQRLGGKIWVNSEPEIGSTFHFTLPHRIPNCDEDCTNCTQTSQKESVIPRFERETFNILLAEDEPVNAELVLLQFEKMGHTAKIANNGKEAVELFKTQAFDLILMDLQMPVMDGFEASRKIRRIEESTGTHTPIIALTGGYVDDLQEECRIAKIDKIVGKPIPFDVLINLIQDCKEESCLETKIATDTPKAPQSTFEIDGVDVSQGIDKWETCDEYVRALHLFKDKYEHVAATIKEHIETDNFKDARFLIHTLLGLTGNLSMHRIYTMLGDCQYPLQTQEKRQSLAMVGLVEIELKNFFSALEKITLSHGTIQPKPSFEDLEETNRVLEALRIQLTRGEFDDVLIDDAIKRLKGRVPEKGLAHFRLYINQFDFRAANETLVSLTETLNGT